MTTIREAIEEWERTNVLNSSAVTRDETVYNHIRGAVQTLKAAPWAALEASGPLPPPETEKPADGAAEAP